MKKILLFILLILLYSCSSIKNDLSNVFELDKTEETIERLIIDSEYLHLE